jgi:hypothetical protein
MPIIMEDTATQTTLDLLDALEQEVASAFVEAENAKRRAKDPDEEDFDDDR